MALRELAAELGLPDHPEPERLQVSIAQRILQNEALTRKLEADLDIATRLQRPDLEARAERAEGHLLWAYALFVLVGLAGAIAIPLLAY